MDEFKRICICKYCGRPEYWDDLDGPRPTMEDYKKQEAGEGR